MTDRLQAEVDSEVAADAACDALLSTEAGLVVSSVLGDERVDLSKAAGFAAVLGRPRLPFGHLGVEAGASLSNHLDDAFGAIHESCGPVESLVGLLAVAAPGQAAVTVECFERFIGRALFLTGLGQGGGGPLLVFLEGGEGVEGRTGRLVDDRGQSEPFGPESGSKLGASEEGRVVGRAGWGRGYEGLADWARGGGRGRSPGGVGQ